MTLNCSEKLRKLKINKNDKMTLINQSSGLQMADVIQFWEM